MTYSTTSQHSTLWFSDGNLILKAAGFPAQSFRIHRTFLERHSKLISKRYAVGGSQAQLQDGLTEIELDGMNHADIEAFLLHLYHILPLSSTIPFENLASVVRASSPTQLDCPEIHNSALMYFVQRFPDEPIPNFDHPNLEDAAKLALEYDIVPARKMIYYALIRTTNAGHEHDGHDNPTPQLPAPLPKILAHLLTSIVAHFSPILFTVATSNSHMACTDAFAETWMDLVIAPALGDDGVYKPLETLERIRNIPWTEKGLCENCLRDKREEWKDEMDALWKLMDTWITEGERL